MRGLELSLPSYPWEFSGNCLFHISELELERKEEIGKRKQVNSIMDYLELTIISQPIMGLEENFHNFICFCDKLYNETMK